MKLVAMMLMHNDADRYLGPVLERVTSYTDETVILDDGSEDGSVEIAKGYPNTIVYHNESSHWWTHGENKLREQLYGLTIERNPDWVLWVASDEIYEKRFEKEVRVMMEVECRWFQFLICNMWDETHFITPAFVNHGTKYLFRFEKDKSRAFLNMKMHCGGIPGYLMGDHNGIKTDLRIKHLGHLRKEDRLMRIERNERFANTPGNSAWLSVVEAYKSYEIKPPKLAEWIE